MTKTIGNLYTEIKNALEEDLSTADVVAIHNNFCANYGFEKFIYPMSELDIELEGKTPTEILNMVDEEFDTNDNYFCIDCGWLCSFDWSTDTNSPIRFDTLAKYIVNNDDALGNKRIQSILDDFEESEDGEDE